MANREKSKRPKVAEEEPKDEALDAPAEDDASLATRDEEADEGEAEPADLVGPVVPGETEGATVDGEGEPVAAQLGTDRYVLAAFFASGMLIAYIIGKVIHGVWSTVSNKDWFSRTVPALASIGDDDKETYGMVIGGIIALVLVLRTYRNPEIRTWADDVASELAKVKWPTKKDVTNSTFVVITATAVATLYLALLDRFWAFVTNLVYGDGS